MCLIALQGIREFKLESAIVHRVKASFATIHASFISFKDVRAQVNANRGASFVSTQTRVRPNAFHFRRQVLILQRAGAGSAERQFNDWEQSTSIARAFSIGRTEAEAVSALMTKVQKEVVERLCAAVKSRGMAKLLTHDLLSKGLLNLAWTSGIGPTEAWKEELRNRDDGVLVNLVVDRIVGDHDKALPTMRKAVNFKEGLLLHQAAGLFLHFLRALQGVSPAGSFTDARSKLEDQFRQGPFFAQIECTLRSEKEAKEQLLQKQLREADLNTVAAQVLSDFAVLEKMAPGPTRQAEEHALDMKYLRDRQAKGQEYVEDWLSKNASLVQVAESMDTAVGEFLKFKEQYIICTVDTTVFPANASYIAAALKNFCTFLSMGSTTVGFVLFPVYQSQTSEQALVKHRHQLELALLKGGLSVINSVQVLYTKPESGASDKRALAQPAMATFHSHFSDHAFLKSKPVRTGTLGPVPLIKFSELLGFDDVSKPGASARVEQKGVPCHEEMIQSLLDGVPIDDKDTVILLDVVPNRFSEFGRAAVNMNLRGDGPTVHYFGLIQQEYKTNLTAVKSMVYKKWDEDTNLSPPKTRPLRESSAAAAAVPSLDILAWANDRPVFPAVLLTKFPEGTAEHARMLELKKDFDEKYPEASQPPPAVGSGRAGDAKSETHGIPWRLTSDFDLVSYKKVIMPLCQLLRKLAIDQGLSEIEVCDHVLKPRLAEDGVLPICFRYVIAPVESKATNVFKPQPAGDGGSDPVRHQTLGSSLAGNFDKLIGNKRASLVWEVDIETSPGRLVATKPKIYLTCGFRLPSKSWVNLSA
ncbi:FO synthase subunit 1 [Durusdinium trenchii]|uniref:FO synthase subunit 1 n=1 Tax=Durusdinium trenchii TaxID=1381693 RepID=A0ABP0QTL8_9DINO